MGNNRKRGLITAWNTQKRGGTVSVSVNDHYYINWRWIVSAPEGCLNPLGFVAEFDAVEPATPAGTVRCAKNAVITLPAAAKTGTDILGGVL